MRKFKNFIKNLMFPWERNLLVNRYIFGYYTDTEDYGTNFTKLNQFQITDILSRRFTNMKEDVLEVKIILFRPSLIIGRKGEEINALKFHLEKEFSVKVQIKLEENHLWTWNKYKKS